jgi:phage shock protein E
MSWFHSMFGGGAKADPMTVKSLVADGAQLLDVRTPGEFSAGALPGAVNIPVSELEARLDEVSRDRAVIVYCRSGARSGRASNTLQSAGFAQVHDLGAMAAWPG